MTDLLRLDGRIVVVSGAGGGGIGTAVTEMAARAGATVVAVSRSQDNLDHHVGPLVDGGLDLRWSHVGADNTSLFLKDDDFRNEIRRP